MLAREPLGPVGLALKKAGGAAETAQLAAATGLPRQQVLDELEKLAATGHAAWAGGRWQVAQTAALHPGARGSAAGRRW